MDLQWKKQQNYWKLSEQSSVELFVSAIQWIYILYIIVTRSNHFWQMHSCQIRWFIDKISVYYCQISWWWDRLCKTLKLVSVTCTKDLYKHTKSPLRTLFRAVLRSIINTKRENSETIKYTRLHTDLWAS